MIIRITENELKQIVDKTVNHYLANRSFFKEKYNTDRSYISEGLTCSYNIGKVKNILFRKYDFKNLGIQWGEADMNPKSENLLTPLFGQHKKVEDTDNWYFFTLELKNGIGNNAEIINDIIHDCDACGWYLSEGKYYLRNGLKQEIQVKNCNSLNFNDEKLLKEPLVLTFRAKFNAEYKKASVPRYLYHIAPTRVLDKILKQGITPRNNGRIASHPERVYLFIDYPHNWQEIADNFRKTNKEEEYVLLKIDKSKINGEVKFYYDSNIMLDNPAVYTYEPIPPSAINITEREDIFSK